MYDAPRTPVVSAIQLTDRSAFKEAMNSELQLDRSKTAVVTIDLQRKYLDQRIGESPVPVDEGSRVIESTSYLLDAARRMDIPVIHAYVTRREEELDGPYPRGILPYIRAAAAIGASQIPDRATPYRPDRVIGSPQSELVDTLAGEGDIHIANKKSWDSFQYTDLEFLLASTLGVDTVVIAGINTDTCVYSTVFAAANRGFRTVVVSDCVASMRGRDSHLMALELMSRSIAWVLPLQQLISKFDV